MDLITHFLMSVYNFLENDNKKTVFEYNEQPLKNGGVRFTLKRKGLKDFDIEGVFYENPKQNHFHTNILLLSEFEALTEYIDGEYLLARSLDLQILNASQSSQVRAIICKHLKCDAVTYNNQDTCDCEDERNVDIS